MPESISLGQDGRDIHRPSLRKGPSFDQSTMAKVGACKTMTNPMETIWIK
jgi:hypothetical protein